MREMSTGDIMTTKKLQSQNKPVEIATDFPRVCKGVISTGIKKARPLVPTAQAVLKMLENEKVSYVSRKHWKIIWYSQNEDYCHISANLVVWICNCGSDNDHAKTLHYRSKQQQGPTPNSVDERNRNEARKPKFEADKTGNE